MRESDDKLCWLPAKDGEFSVKSLYHIDQKMRFEATRSQNADIMGKVWNVDIHERSKIFLWRILSKVLPIRSVLASRFHVPDASCSMCNSGLETDEHLFFECSYARAL